MGPAGNSQHSEHATSIYPPPPSPLFTSCVAGVDAPHHLHIFTISPAHTAPWVNASRGGGVLLTRLCYKSGLGERGERGQ